MVVDRFGNELVTQVDQSQESMVKLNRDMSQYGEWSFVSSPSACGAMSYKQLRTVYALSSAVRPAVDSIAREISFLPYKITDKDFKYHNPAEFASIIDFLTDPNLDDDDLPTILTRFITDLLVIGKGVIEKVRNAQGKILEIVARDASLFTPKVNDYGFIIGYLEYDRQTFLPKTLHKKENIIYKYFTPTTYTFGSTPIIETIVNEVSLLMLSVKSIAWAFTKDEIPPGILHLGVIGTERGQHADT